MTDENETMKCTFWCWGLAALAALLTVILCLVIGGMGWIASLFFAIVVFVVLGFLLGWLFCRPLAPLNAQGAQTVDHKTSSQPTQETPVQPAAVAPAPEAQPAPAAPEPVAEEPVSAEPTAAAQPSGLDAARNGQADDLKRIKGVGPKLEQLLNSLGFFHFDQIAAWTASEIAWVDENLQGFKGRVTRDNWVAQAKTLAAGGDTEFSKSVDNGDVY
jgi:NADH-quinone oxidoreductase subunit E